MYFSSRKKESRGVFSSVQENTIEAAPTEMEYSEFHEAHERSLKMSMIRVGIVWLFSFVAIFAAGSLEIPLYFVSLADLKTRVGILGSVYTVLKNLRTQVRILGIVCTVLQSVSKVHWALGFALVFITGSVMYYSSQRKQSRGVFSSIQEDPSFCTPSNSPEASQQFWKPISLLNVKLKPEYSVGKMSSSKSTRIRNKLLEKVISLVKVKLEMVFSVEERRSSEKVAPVGSFSKRLSSSRHSVLKQELSMGSSPSSIECKKKCLCEDP